MSDEASGSVTVVDEQTLKAEIAGAEVSGVRTPISGYPADGLNPARLAQIMKSADQGSPLAYFELAELIEERDLHYMGILGTRKRQVSQIPVRVEAASPDKDHQAQAELVRQWLTRDELQDELFDMLDAVGKGISYSEIIWDKSEGQWWPRKLDWRSQRWFTFDRLTFDRPLLRSGEGDIELPSYKFIVSRIKAKSGLAIRSGIARAACWAWMWKAFTTKDWALFSQTYGQPTRVGRYPAGAMKEEKATLLRAVTNIASDCAAIIPQGMSIEFIESKTAQQSGSLYRERADWIDQQLSKAVLGQTATTDAIAGGHAVGKEHRKVQEDIACADARSLAGVLNSDLMRPFIILNFGPQRAYPRFVIEEADKDDVDALSQAVERMVRLGMPVSAAKTRERLSLPAPEGPNDTLVAPPAAQSAANLPAGSFPQPKQVQPTARLHAAAPSSQDIVDQIAAVAAAKLQPSLDGLIDAVRRLVDEAATLEDVRASLLELFPGLPEADVAGAMRLAMTFAELAGRDDAGA